MSEDYSDCPRCERMHERRIELAEIKVRDAYGKVTQSEFEALQQKVAHLKEKGCKQETLTEQYEHWFDSRNRFRRRYNCTCEECGFNFIADNVEEEAGDELSFRDSDLEDEDE